MLFLSSSSLLRKIRVSSLPPLSYGLSRNIDVPWLAPLAYALSVISLIALIILNVALTTYDAIVVTSDNYNATQTLWYHRFTGPPTPGSQCSSYNVTVGQQFTTTATILTYTLLSIDGGKRIFPYTGTPLGSCDVVSATIDANRDGTSVTYIAYVACNTTGLQITAKTEYIWSILPSLEDHGQASAGSYFYSPASGRPQVIGFIAHALGEVGTSLKSLLQIPSTQSLPSVPGRISIQGVPSCSPHPDYADLVSGLCNDDNSVPVTWLYGGPLEQYFGFANGTELTGYYENDQTAGPYWINLGTLYDSQSHHTNISNIYYPAITNALQIFISAVRLDFGHILPNNAFLNMTIMNQTLQNPLSGRLAEFKSRPWSAVLEDLGDERNFAGYHMNDFLQGNSTYMNGEYQCRFWYSIGWAQATVNVLVATLSLFTSGWGFAMVVIAFFITRTPESNWCIGHIATKSAKSPPSDQEKADSFAASGSEAGATMV